MISPEDVRMVAPALERYTHDRLLGDVWKRPGLSPRDRSIVTLAVLITRNQTVEMPHYLNMALDNGIKPREISEIITQDCIKHTMTPAGLMRFATYMQKIGMIKVVPASWRDYAFDHLHALPGN